VARMLLQCSFLDDTICIKNVLLHGLVRDKFGKKMSKSLNNGVDPMEIIDKYNADTLRLYLLSQTSSNGYDVNFSMEKIEYYFTFVNKL
jgi:valyl-tRNA synthetase